jgi:DNA-binding NarL/FixJ family response regulator
VTVRVLVVDDQELVRAGFSMIVDAADGLDVVGEASNGREAVEQVRRLRPDVVLMDVRMPEMDGVAATRHIVDADADGAPRVLVLTTFDLDEYVVEALRAGASGFLLKDVRPEDLVEGVRAVAAGDAIVAPSVTRRLLDRFARRLPASSPDASHEVDQLTDRELEVLRLMARGFSNAEIAAALFVATTTVKTHVGRVLTKLGLRDRVQAVVWAYDHGVVEPGA